MAKTEEDAETDTATRCTKLPNNGDAEIDQETKSKIAELKREFEEHVKYILQEDDYSVDTIFKSIKLLSCLETYYSNKEKNVSVPEPFFRFPLTNEIMGDPVASASGMTYDRPQIKQYLKDVGETCPKTKEMLPLTTTLTSNNREHIWNWRDMKGKEIQEPDQKEKAAEEPNPKEKAIEVAEPTENINEEINTDADIVYLNWLLKKLEYSSTLPEKREAATKLRRLTECIKPFRALFGEPEDAISRLISPFSEGRDALPHDIEENLITTILNISIQEGNIELQGENLRVIPVLIESLKFGTSETRRNAAAALDSLSAYEPNAIIIGKSGAFKPLAHLLENGDPLAMKDAASAIFHLCKPPWNRSNAFSEGVVKVIINKIKAHTLVHDISDIQAHLLVDIMLDILAILSTVFQALYEMADLGGVPCLLGILRDRNTSDHIKENAVFILFMIGFHVVAKRIEIKEEEYARGTISNIAARGTERARRKAERILEWINSFSDTYS